MDPTVHMLEHNVWFAEQLLRAAEHVGGEVLDRPIGLSVPGVDDEPTLRSQLSRLVIQLEMWNSNFAGRTFDWPQQKASIAELRARLAEAGDMFLESMRHIAREDRWDEIVICPGDEPENDTYAGVAAHVVMYSAYRRILATGALAAAGVTDLDEDPIRWVSARSPGDG